MVSHLKKTGLAILAALLLWFLGFVFFTFNVFTLSIEAPEDTTDAIVVLTGGHNRVEEGLDLYANGRGSHLFVSGVYEDVRKREITSRWSGDHALPPCCVSLGYNATTTLQNALETREWMIEHDYTSLRLVTGNYHMPRSIMEFKHAMPGIQIYAHPLKQPDLNVLSLRFWELMFSEYHKAIYRSVVLIITPKTPMPESE